MADTRSAFADLSQEEMLLLVRDIRDSKRNGRRAEKLVPYAKEIYAKLNVDTENPTVTLRQCLEIAQRFIWKVAESDSFLQTFHGAADEVAGNKLFPVDVISSFKLVIGQNK